MAPEQFDDMPKIILDKEDLDSFHRGRSKSSKDKETPRQDKEESAQVPKQGPSWFVFLFLLIAMAAAGGYWSYGQYKAEQSMQLRITELERRLSTTGEELDQSAVALQVKVSELSEKTNQLWEQMDKLWASAWRRNQAEIKALESSLKTQISSHQNDIAAANTKQDASSKALQLAQQQIDLQAVGLNEINSSTSQSRQKIAKLEQQIDELKERVLSTAMGNNSLADQIDALNKKLQNLEKALADVKTVSTP